MQKTIYKCDRCGKEINFENGSGRLEVYPKKVSLFKGLFSNGDSIHSQVDRFDLCNGCYNKVLKFMKEV